MHLKVEHCQTLCVIKYIYRSKWVDHFWLVKTLSCIVECGQNDSKNQSILRTQSEVYFALYIGTRGLSGASLPLDLPLVNATVIDFTFALVWSMNHPSEENHSLSLFCIHFSLRILPSIDLSMLGRLVLDERITVSITRNTLVQIKEGFMAKYLLSFKGGRPAYAFVM